MLMMCWGVAEFRPWEATSMGKNERIVSTRGRRTCYMAKNN